MKLKLLGTDHWFATDLKSSTICCVKHIKKKKLRFVFSKIQKDEVGIARDGVRIYIRTNTTSRKNTCPTTWK